MDPPGVQIKGPGESLHQLGFPEAGKPLEQDVSACEDSGEDELDEFLLSEDYLLQGTGKGPNMPAGIGDFCF